MCFICSKTGIGLIGAAHAKNDNNEECLILCRSHPMIV
jgi:hypothetical protein